MNSHGGAAALEVRRAAIRFGATQALRGVSLTVQPGSVHALIGQNGSGKSSLVKIITGVYRPARGTEISVAGTRLEMPITSSQLASARVGVVHQDMAIVPTMSIADNVMVTAEGVKRLSWINKRATQHAVEELLERLALHVDVTADAGVLSEAGKAVLAFGRALYRLESLVPTGQKHPGLMILDEVTARLGPADSGVVLATVRRLADRGYGVLFVGHRLDEVVSLCDRATVLRDGAVAGDLAESDLTTANLLHLATGEHRLADADRIVGAATGGRAFSARVSTGLAFETCLDAEVGEVLGVTGLADSGIDALPYALIGRLGSREGHLRVGDMDFDVRSLTPDRALRAGIGLIPGDRVRKGIAGTLSTSENLSISRHALATGIRALAPIRAGRLRQASESLIHTYGVTPADPSRRTAGLSGGNQQKVLVARALQLGPRLLIAHEPTAGVDVVARAEIFRLMRRAAQDGCVVIVCSQDLDEVWDSCDRVLVLHQGAVAASYRPGVDPKTACIQAVLSPVAGRGGRRVIRDSDREELA